MRLGFYSGFGGIRNRFSNSIEPGIAKDSPGSMENTINL